MKRNNTAARRSYRVGLWVITSLAMLTIPVYSGKRVGAQTPIGTTPIAPPALATRDSRWFNEIEKRTAFFGLKPLWRQSLPSDDMEVRIWCNFVDPAKNNYRIKRTHGVWSGVALTPVVPQTEECHFQIPLPRPGNGWESVWARLQEQCDEIVPEQLPPQVGEPRTHNDLTYIIEVRQGDTYHEYLHGSRAAHNQVADDRLRVLLQSLEEAFLPVDGPTEITAPLSPEAARHLTHDQFQEFHTTREIPDWVWQALRQGSADSDATIANPGEAWQSSDATVRGLPKRRLLFGGLAGGYCVLAFERGGRGTSRHALLFHKNAHGPFATAIAGSATYLDGTATQNMTSLQKVADLFRVRVIIP